MTIAFVCLFGHIATPTMCVLFGGCLRSHLGHVGGGGARGRRVARDGGQTAEQERLVHLLREALASHDTIGHHMVKYTLATV